MRLFLKNVMIFFSLALRDEGFRIISTTTLLKEGKQTQTKCAMYQDFLFSFFL